MQSMANSGSRVVEINARHPIYSVLFVGDGGQVMSGSRDGWLRRWRVEDGREIGKPIRTEGSEIWAVALSPDRKWLLCGLDSRRSTTELTTVRVWNAQTYERVGYIHQHTGPVCCVDISPDSTKFATGDSDGSAAVFIWSLITGEKLIGPLEHDGWGVISVQFSPGGDRLATATGDYTAKSIRVYDSDNGWQIFNISCQFYPCTSSPLAWSYDGRQLFAGTLGEVKCLDTSSGTLINKWAVPGGGSATSIVLAHNQKFAIVITNQALSFWDISTCQKIGTVIKLTSMIWWTSLSPNDDYVITGEENGKITIRTLRDILPSSYLQNLPFMCISETILEPWTHGDLTRVEALLNEDIIHSVSHARALAYRALVRTRSRHWSSAIEDAEESIKIERSAIGYIAHAIALIGNGEYESAMEVFDSVFSNSLPGNKNFLLLIKAVILFEHGKHDSAISRVGRLIDMSDHDLSPYVTVRTQMLLQREAKSLGGGDHKRAIELFKRAKEAIPAQKDPHLVVISLIFGWNFDRLSTEIQLLLAEAIYIMVDTVGEGALKTEMTADWDPGVARTCATTFESRGDEATKANDPKRAIARYSAALFLNPSKPAGILVKRSTARGMLGGWQDALKDADEAIKADPSSPWGYEKRYAALHGLQRYDEAMDAFSRMHSFIESSPDPDARQLATKYLSPSRSETAIDDIVRGVSKVSPLVLIDVKSGRLCNGPERMHVFKSEPEFKGLVCAMTRALDDKHIQRVVEKFFRYVTLSHVWQGKEPLLQDVERAGSVWELDPSPLNNKLCRFCEVVRTDGYRWAWSDTCCIDKTISTVLNQSLKMMYKWYEASAATFVLLADVPSSSTCGGLKGSKWLTRAWTSQELLAPIVIRFYSRDWKPYLGDTQSNHKKSPAIMEELADAIGVAHNIIATFNPDDLTVREKLRLASTRQATVDEDVAYSLIGIFKSDIRPEYGEGDAALGHLLEEIVARSGEVMVLAWNGNSSSYNSCLPVSLAVYDHSPGSFPPIPDTEMNQRVVALRNSLSQADAILVYDKITRLSPARFANRRLHLPCIIFTVRRLGIQGFTSDLENHYRAKVSGIGDVEFRTLDRLPVAEPRKLIFVHPWLRELRDPHDGFTWGRTAHDDDGSDSEAESSSEPTSPLHALPTTAMDDYTRALRLIVRLQQPFHALLLEQQPNGEFKRVATEHEIVVSGIKRSDTFSRDVQTAVVEVL